MTISTIDKWETSSDASTFYCEDEHQKIWGYEVPPLHRHPESKT